MILVIGDDSHLLRQIELLCEDSDTRVMGIADLNDLDAAVSNYAPDAILIGPLVPTGAAIESAAMISSDHPEISIIMIVAILDPEVLRDAMRAGIKDVIEEGSSDEQIAFSIFRAIDISKKLKGSVEPKAGLPDDHLDEDAGKVIMFFSTKGGVGKSVTSTNSAVALSKITGKRVVMLDLDLQFGDVAIMFQLTPKHTIHDVIQVMDRLDEDMLRGFLTVHASSRVQALLAPIRPHEADAVTADHVKVIIKLLKKFSDYVIIDTPAMFSDLVLTALDESDLIYLIATMDLPSIKSVKLTIQTLKQLGYSSEIIRFILNRADSKVWLEVDEVERSLGIKAEARIPSDRVIPRSVNRGMPVVMEYPKSSVARSLMEFARGLQYVESKSVKQRNESGEKNKFTGRTP